MPGINQVFLLMRIRPKSVTLYNMNQVLVVAPAGKFRRSLQVLLPTLPPMPTVRLTDSDPLTLGLKAAPALIVWDFRMLPSAAWLNDVKAVWPSTRCLALVDDAAQHNAAAAAGADVIAPTGIRAADLAAHLTALLTAPPTPLQEKKTMNTSTTPEQLALNFAQAFNRRDLEAILSLFEPEAVLAPQPGQAVSGADGLRGALAGFLGLKAPFDLSLRRVLSTGDTALIIGDWRLEGVGLAGTTADVARRDADGVWRYVIDNPFGTL